MTETFSTHGYRATLTLMKVSFKMVAICLDDSLECLGKPCSWRAC